jgi:SAM-dependent methyltransferase
MRLTSPANGAPLTPATPGVLSDGERRWPVVEGIPYLRIERDDLRDAAVSALERGDERGALLLLLRDQDDWAPEEPPSEQALASLLDNPPSLRRAMGLLGFGRVGDYFAYRWSDPTWLAGLALLDAHWTAPRWAFELACGIGQYSRELARRGVHTVAGDVVFAKLWLARRYVAPTTALICFDAAAPWPLPDRAVDLAVCHDALYFLPNKPHVARECARVAPVVAVAHAHNAEVDNFSPGEPLTSHGYARLFAGATCYDDAELTAALLADRLPVPAPPTALRGSEAVGLVAGAPRSHRAGTSGLPLPPPGTRLRHNPLLGRGEVWPGEVRWPSARYAAEYAARSGYLTEPVGYSVPAEAVAGSHPAVDGLARRRLLLDLPERW